MNGLKHGIFSERTVLPDESPVEFARFRESILKAMPPHGMQQLMLCEQIIALRWRLCRFNRLATLTDRVAIARFIRHEQRLMSALNRCEDDFVKLREQSQQSQAARSAQHSARSSDPRECDDPEREKTCDFGHIEPTARRADSAPAGLPFAPRSS
jgi:hypothetical protein